MALCAGAVAAAAGVLNDSQWRLLAPEAVFASSPVEMGMKQNQDRARTVPPGPWRICHVCRDSVTQQIASPSPFLRRWPPVGSPQLCALSKVGRFHPLQGQNTLGAFPSLRTRHEFCRGGENFGHGHQAVTSMTTVPRAAHTAANLYVSPVERLSNWLAHKLVESRAATMLPFTIRASRVAVILRELFILILLQAALHQVEPIMRHANELWSKYLRRDDEVTEEEFQSSGFRALVEPFCASVVIMVITHWLRVISPLVGIRLSHGTIAILRRVGLVVTSVWFLLKWKQKVADSVLYDESGRRSPQLFLLDKLTSIGVLMIGAIVGAEALGLQLKTLFALGGLSGIALGLASKDLVSNLFAGAVLYTTRPFVIGDKIKASKDIDGVVQDIGFYQTRLINSDNLPVIVPNSLMMSTVVINISRAKSRAMAGTFHLRHEDIMRIDDITKKIEKMIQEDPLTAGSPRVTLGSLNVFGLELRLSCAIKSTNNTVFYRKQHDILVKAADIIKECGGKLVSLTELPGFSASGMAAIGSQPPGINFLPMNMPSSLPKPN